VLKTIGSLFNRFDKDHQHDRQTDKQMDKKDHHSAEHVCIKCIKLQ